MLTDNRDDWVNRPRKHSVTEADRRKLVERHFETAQLRQAESDLALLRAVQLLKAFRRMREG